MPLPSRKLALIAALIAGAVLACKAERPSAEVPGWVGDMERENAERMEALQERLEAVRQASADDRGDLRRTERVFTDPAYPPIDALVLEVKPELELVILNKGEKDEVEVGFVFDVYRDTTYKGQIRIQDVQESTSTGRILHEMNPIGPGDSATTCL